MPAELKGTANVTSANSATVYTVNFDTGDCDCQYGAGWRWDNRRWVANSFCSHKLKALSSLLTMQGDDASEELLNCYATQIGRTYNVFVAVSAMHKEIRRGDTKAALYWGSALLPHRGATGVITYLRNILFEETRDLGLTAYILKLSSKGRSVTVLESQRAIARFCEAPKKWELPWRYDIFMDEQRGYQRLVKRFGSDVAKGKDIIDAKYTPALTKLMLQGFATKDRVAVQEGLKGWFKSQSKDHDKMKLTMLNVLIDVMNEAFPNAFDVDLEYTHRLYDLIMLRTRNHGAPGYHELNALCDALTGESGGTTATLSTLNHKRLINAPTLYRPPLGSKRAVPAYAHDNHTWDGKRRMKAYPAELQPGADQVNLDFRMCGAYFGVAWRTLAFKQHATIDCKWGDVSWRTPNWLYQHVADMFY
jgi:phage tail tube protein FII